MPIDARRQVEFISYLQRLLVEGDFVATYKFALLHAIADVCIERPLILNADPEQKTAISIDELVEKFIELYWQHSLPFGAVKVVSLARTQWVQKVAEFPANQVVIGNKGNLSEFLFGSDRQTITHARPVLLDIQKGQCFYCHKSLKETGEVDHFIPWARYPNDLGHNFVLAHSSCNNNKRDHLAAQRHKDNWYEQNIIQHGQALHSELSRYFVCESDRSEAITTWAYQLAGQNRSPLWLDKKP